MLLVAILIYYMENLVKKWDKYGILKGFRDKDKANCAVLLENQKIINESLETPKYLTWRRLSIPMVRRIVGGNVINDIVDVAAVSLENNKNMRERELRTCFNWVWTQRLSVNLDVEAEYTAIICQEISLEMTREILHGIYSHPLVEKSVWDCAAEGETVNEKYESLYAKVDELSDAGTEYVVTSPEIAWIFEASCAFAPCEDYQDFTSSLGVSYAGTINKKWKLYKDPLFPVGKILVGRQSGYRYYPQVIATVAGEGFNGTKLKTIYDKEMVNPGAFKSLTVVNFTA